MIGGYKLPFILKVGEIMKHVLKEMLVFFIFLVGGIDSALISLAVVMLIDYITGVSSAIYNKKLNSKIGLKGIIKKLCYLGGVGLAVIVDKICGQTGVFRTLVIYFLIANDGISIIENMAEMNIPLPKKLIKILEQLKKDNDEER